MYGGSLTLISASDSFKRVQPTLGVRLVTITLTAALSLVGRRWPAPSRSWRTSRTSCCWCSTSSSRGPRSTWSTTSSSAAATTRSRRSSSPHGIYGRWGWRGIVSYLVGFVAMVPFFSTGHVLHRLGRERRQGRRLLAVHRAAGLRRPLLGAVRATSTSTPRRRLAEREADELERRPASTCVPRPHEPAADAWAMAAAVRAGRDLRRVELVEAALATHRGDGRRGQRVHGRARRARRSTRAPGRRPPRRGRATCRCSAYRSRSRTTSGWPAQPATNGSRRARATSCPTSTPSRSPGCGRPARSSSARPTTRSSATAATPTTTCSA